MAKEVLAKEVLVNEVLAQRRRQDSIGRAVLEKQY